MQSKEKVETKHKWKLQNDIGRREVKLMFNFLPESKASNSILIKSEIDDFSCAYV